MNKTVELGWINERIQLVAFDGQFIEGAKADRRHMACRFLIVGEGNYKLFAKEHIPHKEIARLLLESKTIARTLNRVAFIVSANHLLNSLSSSKESEQRPQMDEYLIIAVRRHHGLCHQEIYVCKNDPQSQGYKVAHSRPYLWSVLVRGGELFGVNISHWESIQELNKYNALKLAAGQWLIDEMIEQGKDVLNHKIKRDATVEDYQPDIEALNKIVEEYRHALVQ